MDKIFNIYIKNTIHYFTLSLYNSHVEGVDDMYNNFNACKVNKKIITISVEWNKFVNGEVSMENVKFSKKGIQVTYLNAKCDVIKENIYDVCTEADQVYSCVQDVIKQILLIEATSIKVVHYLTRLEPLKDDLVIAREFALILPNIDVELKDYIMVTKSGHLSLIEQGFTKQLMVIWLR